MDINIELLGLARQGYNFYKAKEADEVIRQIWRALKSVYSDIAEAHFNSALSAIDSAKHSQLKKLVPRSNIW